MAIGLVCKQIETQLIERLDNSTTGLNATLQALEADYGIDGYAIDFGARSDNFCIGQADAEDLEESNFGYPMLILWTNAPVDMVSQKFVDFSGTVTAFMQIHLTTPANNIKSDLLESLSNMTVDAIVKVVARESHQNWSAEIGYGGRISLEKSPLIRDAEHWRQFVTAAIPFIVNVPNVGTIP